MARRRAQLTLLDLLPMATKRHAQILKESTDERVVLKATEMVYDRTGLDKVGAGDNSIVKEMIVARLLDMQGGVPPEQVTEQDEDIVEAELVDDELEDLL